MREKKREQYDVVIIGGGAAGLTAGIYCGRARLKTLIIEKALVGGLATYTNEIANFPGFPEPLPGLDLMNLFKKQAEGFGVKFKGTDVKSVNFEGDVKIVETFRNIFEAKAVIVAAGGRPRVTTAKNEEKYLFDKGISFCATCDAAANTDKTVMVIGSGDAAIEEGMFLTKFAKKVIVSVIHDEGKMDCNEIAREQALSNPKMEFKWNTLADSFEGEEQLERVVLKNLKTGELDPVAVDTCFEFIGYLPNTEIFENILKLSKQKYVITNERMETGIPGVFAAGDVREKELKQVSTAVGDGAIAGVGSEKYIAETEMFEKQIMQKEKVGLIYVYSAINAPSRELLPVLQETAESYDGKIKMNVIDLYKGKTLCDRLSCDIEPMTIFYTKNGEVSAVSTDCSTPAVKKQLDALLA
ncbi:FAD-dependent oxidoreductase [Sediminispirochaeta smaragdinae]|jgi:thioredoxin reductase (NADPH)|uniref:FAD-dependent pyridine nucleotide-disulfide oxidoreductase n=1 Tax=Sediminispirochaeta smaragdinae (strain DSM 11293 / JCM 15392 / SEBR 4228) TaxID=573413 RepID=E1RBA1_SEDSS|nr:FAD-dependent oxidoreductase [Sediminispirochaeta smaragdinae]ADK79631.1 FAD-dependent pyridine nucleotide-disulfide oxidoreductase [Sediminispirochaeta smaragdinae DSM 11293]